VLLHSEGPEGVCYVETKNLDGETNLKMKQTPKVLHRTYDQDLQLAKLNGVIQYEGPNKQIYKFDANMRFNPNSDRFVDQDDIPNLDEVVVPLNNDTILLRGMSLKNTPAVIGCVLYTGHDTKI